MLDWPVLHRRHYFAKKLWRSRTDAKKKKYRPCSATVEEIMESFTGRCAICKMPERKGEGGLCLDHCHKTGEFRGFLCMKCNFATSFVKDSPEIARRLLLYLKRWNELTSRKNKHLFMPSILPYPSWGP